MRRVTLPMTRETIASLHAGEYVYLSGVVYTARDAAHARLAECIRKQQPLPFDLRDQTIYYVGPSQTPPGKIYGSCGPTTSTRMDAYTPLLLDQGMQACIGKGRRGAAVKEALMKHQAIYFVTIGGLGALLQKCVKQVEPIAYPELQAEAITRLTIEDFPVYVGIDIDGDDIYEQ